MAYSIHRANPYRSSFPPCQHFYRIRLLLNFIIVLVLVIIPFSSSQACRYTIREIGFSTLSNHSYVLYRINEADSFFPDQLTEDFANTNIKTYALNKIGNNSSPIVQFAIENKLRLPAYILAAQNNQLLSLSDVSNRKDILQQTLFSPAREQLLSKLPATYAIVLLVESTNKEANKTAISITSDACKDIKSVLPHMPKQVEKAPEMIRIPADRFQEEKILLWSLGLSNIPKNPVAFVIYGRGRVMGEKIPFSSMKNNHIYKLLSIIGADCECGLDRKWMLGFQIPLNWPHGTRQSLSDLLGFDVDNPMVLTEMSRILATENQMPVNPDGISFEPLVIDLDEEFQDVPVVEHLSTSNLQENKKGNTHNVVIYTLGFFLLILGIGVIFISLKRR